MYCMSKTFSKGFKSIQRDISTSSKLRPVPHFELVHLLLLILLCAAVVLSDKYMALLYHMQKRKKLEVVFVIFFSIFLFFCFCFACMHACKEFKYRQKQSRPPGCDVMLNPLQHVERKIEVYNPFSASN